MIFNYSRGKPKRTEARQQRNTSIVYAVTNQRLEVPDEPSPNERGEHFLAYRKESWSQGKCLIQLDSLLETCFLRPASSCRHGVCDCLYLFSGGMRSEERDLEHQLLAPDSQLRRPLKGGGRRCSHTHRG